MWIEKPSYNLLETPKTQTEEMRMPNDYPEKQGIFSGVSNALRTLSNFLNFNEKTKDNANKPNQFQQFFAKIIGIFNGIDIEKGVTVTNKDDISKIREAFLPIIDLNETSIEIKEWDFIQYNKATGMVEFSPADKTQPSGHAAHSDRGIVVSAEQNTKHAEASKEKEIKNTSQVAKNQETTTTPQQNTNKTTDTKTPEVLTTKNESPKTSKTIEKSPEIQKYPLAYQFWQYVQKVWARDNPATPHKGDCGWAVGTFLQEFGMNPNRVLQWNGNAWHAKLSKDPRFQYIPVNSLSEIPPGAILTYNGKWEYNWKKTGSSMNQKYGHVEIKWTNGNYHYSVLTNIPGGSVFGSKVANKVPRNIVNDFETWKKATGFTGAYIPIAKRKEDVVNAKNKTQHA